MMISKRVGPMTIGLIAMFPGCQAAPVEAPVEAPIEDSAGRLVTAGDSLIILGAPLGAKRGHVFLVASQYTIGGGDDRMRIGLVRGIRTHGKSLEVTELCPIPERERQALASEGLPVVVLREDTRPRVAGCLARYKVKPGAWDGSRPLVDLILDVGLGDGVRLGDRYEVQGEAVADSVNQTVTGFVPLGQCVVQPPITEGQTSCCYAQL